MPEMLTRGQSGSLEVLLKVLNADFLWLWQKGREGKTFDKGQGLGHGKSISVF